MVSVHRVSHTQGRGPSLDPGFFIMKFSIQKQIDGKWVEIDHAESLEDALIFASSVCFQPCEAPEECQDRKIQIVGPDGAVC